MKKSEYSLISIDRTWLEGILLSFLFLFLMIGSLAYNPRMWLQDYPKDIQSMAAPQTAQEKKQFYAIGIPLLTIALVPLVISFIVDGD